MKYIKYKKVFESVTYQAKQTSSGLSYIDAIDEINDILMPLRDDGVMCSVIFPLEENLDLIYVKIPNVDNNLLEPTISHLVNYMNSNGYDMVTAVGSLKVYSSSHIVFYSKTDRGESVVEYISEMCSGLAMDRLNGAISYCKFINRGEEIFNYRNGVLSYNNDIYTTIMNKLKLSRPTFELFLRYVVMKELELEVFVITWE